MPNITQPITPAELIKTKRQIPDSIFLVINTLIQKTWNGQQAVVNVSDILFSVPYTQDEMETNRYFEFVEYYTEKGWKVETDGNSFIFRTK